SDDGRVIDHSQADLRTVSEGQAYALFLPWLANDHATFNRLLVWTENNLSAGSLTRQLPAWHWGKQASGDWGIIDPNSASDADLWMVYNLREAGRVWCRKDYLSKAAKLAALVLEQEVADLPGFGLSLLPGRYGFLQADGTARLNPSYLPGFLLTRLAASMPYEPRWAELYLNSQRLLLKAQKNGLYPDWVQVQNGALQPELPEGDFDAIRHYLWLGLNFDNEPVQNTLERISLPFANAVRKQGQVPVGWNPTTNQLHAQAGPAGFQYALAPLLARLFPHEKPLALPNLNTLRNTTDWRNYGYYNAVLSLFAQGHLQERYRFDDWGRLLRMRVSEGPCKETVQ
ncbi:MAG: cellulase, partial [Limnobacter sp.]|nr:cellulase [Limnobacter sp.]